MRILIGNPTPKNQANNIDSPKVDVLAERLLVKMLDIPSSQKTIDCISYLDMLQQFAFPKADGSLRTILLKQDGASRHFNHHSFSCRMKHFSIGVSAGVTQFNGH
jgi:hypothetical protein